MGTPSGHLIPIERAADAGPEQAGGKGVHLARIAATGLATPPGLCLTTGAYARFLEAGDLRRVLSMELDRKAVGDTRWEELWDSALRIRTRFLATPVPDDIAREIVKGLAGLRARLGAAPSSPIAIRSSAPMEDRAGTSFAGLHESVVGARSDDQVLDAVRTVWASLWSDAALLYRDELGLDLGTSAMAVVLQLVVARPVSGVAFARDPRDPSLERWIVEAVPGPCADLVDGRVDPDRWIVARGTGELLEHRRGDRERAASEPTPLLDDGALARLGETLERLERAFGWPPDVEWTGTGDELVVLQARPVTSRMAPAESDARRQYLGLRPRDGSLATLRREVEEELIPALTADGESLAREDLDVLSNRQLSEALADRLACIERWRVVYRDRFIPLAHGVRRFGVFYNDLMKPRDPFEFVRLLEGERMRATDRNAAIRALAAQVGDHPALERCLRDAPLPWPRLAERCRREPGGAHFVAAFERVLSTELDVVYAGERLSDRPDLLLSIVLATASVEDPSRARASSATEKARLEARFLAAAEGAGGAERAREHLSTGRTAWRLRDDDNLLLGRLEAELLRALEVAGGRLRAVGRFDDAGGAFGERDVTAVCAALSDPAGGTLVRDVPLPDPAGASVHREASPVTSRQLLGEPASPGIATGRVRAIRTAGDLGRVRAGDVIVCDAIQPMMTHVIPLVAAIVERRGGMLIHGAIIARELGVPCVTGVPHALERMPADEIATVDGYAGIVTLGATDFDLEDRQSAIARPS